MSAIPFRSLVFVLRAQQPYKVKAHMGKAVRQCFFAMIHQRNNQLVSELHRGSDKPRPYTVSDLHREQSNRPTILEGETAWFRVTSLDETLARLLSIMVEECPGAAIELDKTPWQIDRVLLSDHPWAGETDDLALGAYHMQQRPERDLTFRFALPTGFHTKGMTMPLPLPILVFESLAQRWKTFSPTPLPHRLESFIEQNISIAKYRGETHQVSLKGGNSEIGFTGEVTYKISYRNPTLENVDPELDQLLVSEFKELAQAVNMLADFAFYSGVGIKTTVGMGMVQRIQKEK